MVAMHTAIKLFFFILFFFLGALHASYCVFIPPQGWLVADPKHLAPSVEIGFIGKSQKGFSPSLNLASEPVNVSLSEYVKIVKKLHESDRNTRWRELGKFSTGIGEGLLTEIDTLAEVGQLRLLQLITLKDGRAYVLTAGALKEEFSRFYGDFEKTFHSLALVSDLYNCIQNPALKSKLEEKINALKAGWQTVEKKATFEEAFSDKKFQKQHWLPFQNFLTKDFTEMGAHWQILFLKNIHKELQTAYDP
jgi:hypothetical protein